MSGLFYVSNTICEDYEFKDMIFKNMEINLNQTIIEIVDILKSYKLIGLKQLVKYTNIKDSAQELLDEYKIAKEHFDLPEPKDPNIVIDNGKITQIIHRKKLTKSTTNWFGSA